MGERVMRELFIGVVRGLALVCGIFHRKQKVDGESRESLGEVVEFLTENPGKLFILRDKTAAMLYHPPSEAVIIVDGDFDGTPNWCNFMLRHRLVELGLMEAPEE